MSDIYFEISMLKHTDRKKVWKTLNKKMVIAVKIILKSRE